MLYICEPFCYHSSHLQSKESTVNTRHSINSESKPEEKSALLNKQKAFYTSTYLEVGTLGYDPDPNAPYLTNRRSQPGGKKIYGGRARLFLFLPDDDPSSQLLKKHSFDMSNEEERTDPKNKEKYGYSILRHRLIDGSLIKQYMVMLGTRKRHRSLTKEFAAYHSYIQHEWDAATLEKLTLFGEKEASEFFSHYSLYSEKESEELQESSLTFNENSYKPFFNITLVDNTFVNTDKIYNTKLRNHFYITHKDQLFFINHAGRCKPVVIEEKIIKIIHQYINSENNYFGIKGKMLKCAPYHTIIEINLDFVHLIKDLFFKLSTEDKRSFLNTNRRTPLTIYNKTRHDNYHAFLAEQKEATIPTDIEEESYFRGTAGSNEFSVKLFFVDKIINIENLFLNSYDFNRQTEEFNDKVTSMVFSCSQSNFTYRNLNRGLDIRFYWSRNCSAQVYHVLEESLNKAHPLYNNLKIFFPKNKLYPVTPSLLHHNMSKLADFLTTYAINDIAMLRKAITSILENAIGSFHNSWDNTIFEKIQACYPDKTFSLFQKLAILKQIKEFKGQHAEDHIGMSVETVDAANFADKIAAITSKERKLGLFQSVSQTSLQTNRITVPSSPRPNIF